MSEALNVVSCQFRSAISRSALAVTVTSFSTDTRVAGELVRGALKFFSRDSSMAPMRARATPGRTATVTDGEPAQLIRLSFASEDAASIRMGSLTWASPDRA
ncbi:hypothetical protein D3C71_1108440 [compost metagenome]